MSNKLLEQKYIERIRKFHLKDSQNATCMNCNKRSFYVVMEFGIFVCDSCADVHRSLGHHIKGIGTSKFDKKEVEKIEHEGNAKAAKVWFPPGFSQKDKPTLEKCKNDQQKFRKQSHSFIEKIYIQKMYNNSKNNNTSVVEASAPEDPSFKQVVTVPPSLGLPKKGRSDSMVTKPIGTVSASGGFSLPVEQTYPSPDNSSKVLSSNAENSRSRTISAPTGRVISMPLTSSNKTNEKSSIQSLTNQLKQNSHSNSGKSSPVTKNDLLDFSSEMVVQPKAESIDDNWFLPPNTAETKSNEKSDTSATSLQSTSGFNPRLLSNDTRSNSFSTLQRGRSSSNPFEYPAPSDNLSTHSMTSPVYITPVTQFPYTTHQFGQNQGVQQKYPTVSQMQYHANSKNPFDDSFNPTPHVPVSQQPISQQPISQTALQQDHQQKQQQFTDPFADLGPKFHL